MKRRLLVVACTGMGMLLIAQAATAVSVLAPGDPILAIDFDPAGSSSSYPDGEPPAAAFDGTLDKYLNFAGAHTGVIFTPNTAAASIATGIQLTTANDAEGRDPASFELWGTNDAIVSEDNGTGLGENWTLIAADSISLPSDRDTVGPLVSFANADEFTSYKVLFPTLKGDPFMQVAEIDLFGDVPGTGTDLELIAGATPLTGDALAIQFAPDSRTPGAEGVANVIDSDVGTKYLNFGRENSGFIVTPASGPAAVKTFQITTANDAESRDPTSWELYGTNDEILSENNSRGDGGENWELVESGSIDLPVERQAPGPFVIFSNDTEYASYMMVFPTIRDPEAANADSMQISEIQFFSEQVPEPSAVVLGVLTAVCGAGALRLRRR